MSKSKKPLPSQVDKPAVQQQLLSIKPKKSEQESESTEAQAPEHAANEVKQEVSAPDNSEPSPVEKSAVQPQLLAIKPKKVIGELPTKVVSGDDSQEKTSDAPTPRPRSASYPEKPSTTSPSFQKPIPRKPQPPPYKNLEQVTVGEGKTFAVGEHIQITTANYGDYTVEIKFIYEASDGSIWASYSHVDKEQRHPWRWGCCRVDHLKKLDC